MKYIVVLGDGMADWKIAELGNKTCLEAAKTPNLDKLAPILSNRRSSAREYPNHSLSLYIYSATRAEAAHPP